MKAVVRGVARTLGLEIFRARGGVFICPRPRAGHATAVVDYPSPLRLHLGCGARRLEGFVNVDLVPTPATDLVADITRLAMFGDATAQEIRMQAVYEHLFRHERRAAIREWHRVLVPGGTLSVEWIPDFDKVVDAYVNRRPGLMGPVFDLDEAYHHTHGDPAPWNAPEQVHKDLFTRVSVSAELNDAGFDVVSIDNACFGNETIPLNLNLTARKRT